jgi:DNA repair protein RadC
MKITENMSKIWLKKYESLFDEKKEKIRNWLIDIGFFQLSDQEMLKFFLKINERKLPDYKAMVWYILRANRIMDRYKK